MATTSRIGAAEDALTTILKARPGLSGVSVSTGYPVPTPEPEHIWVGGQVDEWEQSNVTTDPDREERFTMQVKVVVLQAEDRYTVVRDRALVLIAEVEGAVRDNPRLAGTVWEAQVASGSLDEFVSDEGRGVGATVKIEVRSFLT